MLVLLRRTSFWPPFMVYISVQMLYMLQISIWASEGSFFHVLHHSCPLWLVGSPMASVMMCFIFPHMSHVLTVIHHTWRRFEPTVAEGRLLSVHNSTTKPPWLDFDRNSIQNTQLSILIDMTPGKHPLDCPISLVKPENTGSKIGSKN